jgi:hypothetical protein
MLEAPIFTRLISFPNHLYLKSTEILQLYNYIIPIFSILWKLLVR